MLDRRSTITAYDSCGLPEADGDAIGAGCVEGDSLPADGLMEVGVEGEGWRFSPAPFPHAASNNTTGRPQTARRMLNPNVTGLPSLRSESTIKGRRRCNDWRLRLS